MKRKLNRQIADHYANSGNALLLTGARQTGKTYAIRQYAQEEHLNLIEVNFLESPTAQQLFEGAESAAEVLTRLTAFTNKPLVEGSTLIFFDEVQKYPEAVTWIKFLVDDGRYRYALSGSLLGVELRNIRSVPVGYMSVIEVKPLDLEDFCRALGVSDSVLSKVGEAWHSRTAVDTVVHKSLMKIVRLYTVVGGMPAAVQKYIDTMDLRAVQQTQRDIIGLYKWDLSQYDAASRLYIGEIFEMMPSQLNAKNKRFVLKELNEHAHFSRLENGFIWLRDAGAALPTYNVEAPVYPLKLNEQRNLFKLFSNDVGLLTSQYAEGTALRLLGEDCTVNYGAIYENLTAQELSAHGWNLHYFNSKRQGELDFVLEDDSGVTPIEVKSGKDYERHHALSNVMGNKAYGITQAYVLCNDNLRVEGEVVYAPIYMLMFIDNRPSPAPMIYAPPIEGLV